MRVGRWIVFILIAFAPALTGFLAGPSAWYEGLRKPAWTPPNWLFGPAWTLLYLMIGISGALAWQALGAGHRALPFAVFGLQLLANGLWTWLFFGLHSPALALADLACLWLLILANMVLFWPSSVPAGLLLAPYFLWVSFAGCLNLAIVRLNG